jgi:hypothetical protein
VTPPPPPAELAWLSDAIGADATLKLIELHGGRRLYIPKAPNQGSQIAREIGLPAAQALAVLRGGEELKVPLARAWRVRLYRSRRWTWSVIAGKLGMTESQVGKLLRAAGATNPQPDLFDQR